MDMEETQSEHIEYFVKQASTLRGSALTTVVVDATSHPSVFAFSEILAVSNVQELEGTENSVYLHLLRMFAHGTWTRYKSFTGNLPQLVPDQVMKLKQLTVLTLAERTKGLPYDVLMQELDFSNVYELEQFIINECLYVGIVSGKFDRLRRCFKVEYAAGRDARPGQLESQTQKLNHWLMMSENLLVSIEKKIKWEEIMSKWDREHRRRVSKKAEDTKRVMSFKADIADVGYFSPVMELYSERRSWLKRRRLSM